MASSSLSHYPIMRDSDQKHTNAKIRVLLVDDEPPARKRLADLLAQDPEVEVTGLCRDGYEALQQIHRQKPDLIFIDVQMPELDGFDVLAQIEPKLLPAVVFVTAYEKYALRAFEIHALDYLLKPFDDDRFFEALARAKESVRLKQYRTEARRISALLAAHADDPRSSGKQPLTRLAVKSRGEIHLIKTADIDYIEGAGVYVSIHSGRRSHLLRERMHFLEERLDQNQFFRIHRSAIVKLASIDRLKKDAQGEYLVVMRNGAALKLSRGRQSALQKKLGLAPPTKSRA